jgi:CRP-like cAMP-binding protein
MSLETVYLFQDVTGPTREEVFLLAARESHSAGEFLFQAGDPPLHLYILEEGRVRLSVRGAGHIAQIVSNPGDALGWSSMAGQDSYTASAECLSAVTVRKIDKQALERILEKDPRSGMGFYRRLAELIGHRLAASYGATLSVHGDRHPQYWG